MVKNAWNVDRRNIMQIVSWELGYKPPTQITGTPRWITKETPRDLSQSGIRLVATPEKQSGEFLDWATKQASVQIHLADIRHFDQLCEMLNGSGGQVEGRYTHFVLAGIVFDTTEQMRVMEKVTVAGKITEQPRVVDVNMRHVPVMNLYLVDGRSVWGVALYPANQYYGRLGGHDTALVLIG